MEVLLVADGHYYRDKQGDVYAESIYDYDFYKRYRLAFDKVYAVVRVEYVDEAPKGKRKASGEGVVFLDLPSYTGPWEYIRKYPRMKKMAKKYCQMAPCGIFRIPGASVNFMCKEFIKTHKPFAVELVVDPWVNFAPGSIKSVLRVPVRVFWTSLVRKMCMKANGTSYVTSRYLQEHYPCAAMRNKEGQNFSASYSSVDLPDESLGAQRTYGRKNSYVISHVANVYNDYGKGHIPLMEAVRLVRKRGYDVSIRFIGDGPKMQEFKDYASRLGIGDSVLFLGRLPNGMAVRDEIRFSDLFVFPTKAEGLPRVLLEAMAEGLPCISSPTCGIPEILDMDFLCQYDDWAGFAEKIVQFLDHPEWMQRESGRNLETARRFTSSVLNGRRKAFYERLRAVAADHP